MLIGIGLTVKSLKRIPVIVTGYGIHIEGAAPFGVKNIRLDQLKKILKIDTECKMGKRENKVETYLNTEIEKLGGTTRKWVSNKPVPDRICIVPGIGMFAVEVKTVDGVLSGGQKREIERLSNYGGHVRVVYGHDDVDRLIEELKVKLS